MSRDTVMDPGIDNVECLDACGRSDEERRNVATAHRVLDGFTRGDFGVLFSHMTPDADLWVTGMHSERLGGMAEVTDPEIVTAFLAALFCNGIHFQVRQAAAAGTVVFVEWDDEALTNRSEAYRNTGISVFTFDGDGRMTAYREYIDPEPFFAAVL